MDNTICKYIKTSSPKPVRIEVFKDVPAPKCYELIKSSLLAVIENLDERTCLSYLESFFREIGVSQSPHFTELVTLSRSRLQHATIVLNWARDHIWLHNGQEASKMLSEMNCPLEVCSLFVRKLEKGVVTKKHSITKEIRKDLDQLLEMKKKCDKNAYGLKQINNGLELIKNYQYHDEELVWMAIDCLKDAFLSCEDIQLKALSLGKIGIIYMKCLKEDDRAVGFLRNSLDILDNIIGIDSLSISWRVEVSMCLKMIMDNFRWKKDRLEIMKMPSVLRSLQLLEYANTSSVESLAEFLIKFFNPSTTKLVTMKDIEKECAEEDGSLNVRKVMKHWETSKLKKSTVSDKKWAVISEQIIKKFSESDEIQVEDDDKEEILGGRKFSVGGV